MLSRRDDAEAQFSHEAGMISGDDDERKLDDFVAPISLEELAKLHEIKWTFKGTIAK